MNVIKKSFVFLEFKELNQKELNASTGVVFVLIPLNYDLWPPEFNHFILKSKCRCVPNIDKNPSMFS